MYFYILAVDYNDESSLTKIQDVGVDFENFFFLKVPVSSPLVH